MGLKEKIHKLFNTGLFHIFGASVVNNVIAFISSIILVRVVSKADYGVFTYAWNIFSIVLLASGFGTDAGALQLLSESLKDKQKFERIFCSALRFGSIFNLILSFAMLIIGLFIPLPIIGSGRLLVMMVILPEFIYWYTMQQIYLRSSMDNVKYSRTSLINTALVAGLTIVGALFWAAEGMVIGRYIAYISSVVIGISIFGVPFIKLREKGLEKSVFNDLLKISGISMLNNGLSQLLYLIDVFVIGLVMTDEIQVATYKVATQIPTALSFIPVAIVTYIYPYFAAHREDRKWCIRKYRLTLLAVGSLNFVISVLLIILAPWLISTIFGEQYMDALVPFRILSASYFFSGTFSVLTGSLLVTQRKLYFNTFVAVLSGVLNIVADYVLVVLFEINGAAMATISVVIITSILNVSYFVAVLVKKNK